ncbi:hypothetical protein NLJ89_g5723 [Agrocybe chaxingu]|uniref:DUF6534 domain-containing protein n=1 Tax=Agrocybe chaxingu TaxID=84603 RepID=A0A9W8K010_9AGAR|nr:hypothetical protein NLJ89_g5723 [Agrocybe chaxingu]
MSAPPSPSLNEPLVDLRPTYGAILIGLLFSIGLLGVTTSQVWQYYSGFPKDPLYLKFIVAYVWVLELLRVAFAGDGVYYYLVLNWGNPVALITLVWTSQVNLLLSPLVELAVRLYFAYRVWILSRRNGIMSPIIILLALAHFGEAVPISEKASCLKLVVLAMGTGAWILSFQNPKVTDYTPLLRSFGTAGLCLAMVADWTISLSLIYWLNKSRSGMARTNSIINYIMFYTINMGLITRTQLPMPSMTDIVVLVLSLWKSPEPQLYFLAIFQVVGNLYANSLLASLNSRTVIRDKEVNVQLSDFSTFAVAAVRMESSRSTTTGSQVDFPSRTDGDLSSINVNEKGPSGYAA